MAEFEGRLSNAPVVYAVCQMRFSPVLKMGDYVPAIQEELRNLYPRFDPQILNSYDLNRVLGQLTPTTSPRWIIRDRHCTSGFVLEQNGISFNTTAYTDFSEFLANFLRGVDAVQRALQLQLVERVGLRYIDLITSAEQEDVNLYVHQRLHGFPIEVSDIHPQNVQLFTACKTDAGTLFIKSSQGIHTEPVPAELMPLSLETTRKPPLGSPSVILDIDHFCELAFDFDRQKLELLLIQLKQPMSKLFKSAITEYAVSKWK